jgi:hypothetical protein
MQSRLTEIFEGLHSPPRKQPHTIPEDLLLSYEEDALDILCINCQEFIQSTCIEGHSTLCVTVSEVVRRLDLYSPLVQVRFKLEKIRDLLSSLRVDRPGDSNYNSIFLRLTGKLLEVKEASDAEENRQVSESITSLMASFKGSACLLIYGERLKSLAYEQMMAVEEVMQDRLPQVNLTRPLQKSLAADQLLSAIHSETGSEVSRNTDFTPSSYHTEELSYTDLSDVLEGADDADLQRYFYSQCLAVKLSYNSRSLAQYVSINRLYSEAKRQQLPLVHWAAFIRQELKAPERWLDKGQSRRPIRPKEGQSRVDTIVEEDETPMSVR